MQRFIEFAFLVTALTASGCEGCVSCNGAGPLGAPSSDDPPSELAEPAAEDAGAAPAPSERPTIEEAASTFAEKMSVIQAAIEAGIEAEEGDSPCERSLTGYHAMFGHLQANTDDESIGQAPNSLVFMHVCEGLPLEAKRCMVLSYGKEHAEECQRIYQELTPEQREQIQALGPARR